MKETRRRFSAAFKAKVAIEALKERDTLASLSNEYGIHGNMIKKWKQDFLTRSIEIFETKASGHDFESEREKLYAKIGQLEMENDWLKKKLGRS
ncbi:MAG: transposase [Bacteroidales bacterium]|nr:transposase [Bacteroidales bacterium]MDZ4203588.1 transposase [Bacteroidales bacterium]